MPAKITNLMPASFYRLGIACFLFCLVFISGKFNDAYIQPKYYFFVVGISLFLLVALFARKKQVQIKIDSISLVFISFCLYLFVRGMFSHITYHIIFAPAVLALFVLFRLYPHRGGLPLIVVMFCIVQSTMGLLQLSGIIPVKHIYPLVGPFDNPAGIAAFLSMGLPLCIILYKQNSLQKYIAIIGATLIIITVVLSQSRSGILAIMVTMIIYCLNRYWVVIVANKTKVFIALFCIIILIVGLFLFKKESASGRILIWKVNAQMFLDNPVFGKGPDALMKDYMEYQGEYFKIHPDDPLAYFADDTQYAFNEYLQIASEYGIIGLLLMLAVIFIAFQSAKNKADPYLLVLIAFSVLACFSYPLRYPVTWVILLFCLADLSNRANVIKQINVSYDYIRIMIGLFVIPAVLITLKDYKFEARWYKIARMSLTGLTEEVMPDFNSLHEQWNGNPYFLYNYGAELNHIEQYEKSNTILNECAKYYNNYKIQMLLADNSFNSQTFENARHHYKEATYMCPNRFLPLRGLLRTFMATGDFDSAKKIALEITRKEIKIPSSSILVTKYEAENFLKSHQN